MKLTQLEPKWWADSGRHGQGIRFNCPHCYEFIIAIAFANPLDGGPAYDAPDMLTWQRTGETFETLTLSPSIDASKLGHWHGHVVNGQILP